MKISAFLGLLVSILTVPAWAEVDIIETSVFALRGDAKYGPDFEHFDYVNPDAPKGGTLRAHSIGTFDSFNRYGQRGDPVVSSDALYDSLMVTNSDEISVYYPLIAEKLTYASDYSFIQFTLNQQARFTDGKPITAHDVAFTYQKFIDQGVPAFARSMSYVDKVVVDNDYQITFHLNDAKRDDVLIFMSLPILPEHYWKDHDLAEPLKEVPVGSSGITISEFKWGQTITYKVLPDYWARDLPAMRGQNNFDFIRFDYYRDVNVAFEAFKTGAFDYWQEGQMKQWFTAYDFPAVEQGLIQKEVRELSIPKPTQGFIFNTQHPLFKDPLVRQALNYAFDFEWMNENLFFEQYLRTRSYFQNTPYMATELPSEQELAILEPIRSQVPQAVFTQVYQSPVTDGSGNNRKQLRQAMDLLKQAGWHIKDKQLVHEETGKMFEFELLMYSPVTERIALPLQKSLKKLGITMKLRQVDSSQYMNRLHEHEFEMISFSYSANPYPSKNLKLAWHSDYINSSYNIANVNDPAIDYLIEGIGEHQDDEEALLHWGRALDRVLLWNHLIIPQWYSDNTYLAYFNRFGRPDTLPKYALGIDSWWDKTAQSAHSKTQ